MHQAARLVNVWRVLPQFAVHLKPRAVALCVFASLHLAVDDASVFSFAIDMVDLRRVRFIGNRRVQDVVHVNRKHRQEAFIPGRRDGIGRMVRLLPSFKQMNINKRIEEKYLGPSVCACRERLVGNRVEHALVRVLTRPKKDKILYPCVCKLTPTLGN